MISDSNIPENDNYVAFIRLDEDWTWYSEYDPVLARQFGSGETELFRGIYQGRLFRSCINHIQQYSPSREAWQCV
jgi:hypothetical protein